MSTHADDAILLTATQKLNLASRFLPVAFFVVALIFSITALPNMLGKSVPVVLPLFLAVVLLITAYEASKALRDLLSGIALVEVDELVRLSHSARGGNNRRYGTFTHLGRMQLREKARREGTVGQCYRVAYSPATRIVWSLDPI